MSILKSTPMTDKPDIAFKPKAHPLIASLPAHLKDPANFEKIMKAIHNTISTTCNHAEIVEWGECKKCTKKMMERRLLLRKLGFKNAAQFMAWRKVHETIKARIPLVDWKKV